MEMFTRAEQHCLIIEYSYNAEPKNDTDKLNEHAVMSDHNLNTDVLLLKGDKFKTIIILSDLVDIPQDSLFLSAFGLFLL
jgi:hypothetical protein